MMNLKDEEIRPDAPAFSRTKNASLQPYLPALERVAREALIAELTLRLDQEQSTYRRSSRVIAAC
jgi:hypothetical protein